MVVCSPIRVGWEGRFRSLLSASPEAEEAALSKNPRSRHLPTLAAVAAATLGSCGSRTEMLHPPPGAGALNSGGAGGTKAPGGSGGQRSASSGADEGAGSSAPVDYGPYTVNADGFVTSGPWQGWAWTSTDNSAISPSSFSGWPAGATLCVQGTVARVSSANSYAILGINIGQSRDDGERDWTPTGPGLAYNITNTANSPLRLQVAATTGVFGTAIRGGQGKLDWNELNSRCWDNSGSIYDGHSPLNNVMVLVPGSDTDSVIFDFCINSIAPL